MSPIYNALSKLRLTSRSYSFKFLFVAFFGIHIPLIGLVIAFAFNLSDVPVWKVLVVTLVLTLVATGITLFILKSLLSPLHVAREALDGYIANRTVPDLPIHFEDEAGVVLRNVQLTINRLEESLSQQKDLNALITHDMRSPISSVLGVVNMIRMETDRNRVLESCDMLEAEMKKQMNYLDDILDMLHQEQMLFQNYQLEKKEIGEIVSSAIDSIEMRAKEKEIIIEKSLQPSLMQAVQPSLFHEVILNLLSNAIKFSPRGGRVTVSAFRLQNGQIAISVKDRGIGFSPELSESFFERFSKMGRKGTEGEKTTGMGLYLSRKIIEQQGGKLVASSEGEGKGSRFEIIFS